MIHEPAALFEGNTFSNPADYEIKATTVHDRGNIAVTALVSTYNSDKFFSECMSDLLKQSLFKKGRLEILVIDSQSPGREKEFSLEVMKTESNITYLRTKNREGLYRAWNRGIAMASGDLLTSANTDDRHRHDALEVLLHVMEQNPRCALAYGDSIVTRNENEIFEVCSVQEFWQLYDFDRIRQIHFAQNGSQPMWRRALHARYGLFDESFRICGDYDWWLRLAQAEEFIHVPELLGLYLESPSSIEHRDPELSLREVTRVRETYSKRAGIELDYTKYPAIVCFPFYTQRSRNRFDRKRRATIIVTPKTLAQTEAILESIYQAQSDDMFEIFLRGDIPANVLKQFHRYADRFRIRVFKDLIPGDPFLSTLTLALNASCDIIFFADDPKRPYVEELEHVSKVFSEQSIDMFQFSSPTQNSKRWLDVLHRTFFSPNVFDLLRQSNGLNEVRELLRLILFKVEPQITDI